MRSVVEAFGDKVFHTVISRTVKFPEATVAAEPITTYASTHAGGRRPTGSWPASSSPAVGRPEPDGRGRLRPTLAPTPASSPAVGRRVTPGGVITRRGGSTPFEVHLDNFEGPFDLLLGLIAKHKLDITEVALARVTDEFIAYIRAHQAATEWDLDQAREFLVVAATLLDLKAARLLPQPSVEDEEDLALLEARDLLFARLLQYRAFKDVAGAFAERMADGRADDRPRRPGWSRSSPRCCPSWSWASRPEQLAMIAARAADAQGGRRPSASSTCTRPRSASASRPRSSSTGCAASGPATFRALVADADSTLVVVARFLALLELFREGGVAFDQAEALGELTVRWTGPDDGEVEVSDEFDEPTSDWRRRP